MFQKKFNSKVAQRSRLARIGRQTRERDEAEELEDVVCRARPLPPMPRSTVTVVVTGPGRKTHVREIPLAS